MGLEKPAGRGKKKPDKIEALASDISSLIEQNKEIASQRSPNSIVPQYSDDKHIHKELKQLYDFLAQTYGYATFDHMIAVAHSVLVAKVIAKPDLVFLPGGGAILKAIDQAQKNIRPEAKQEPSKMPKGETKKDILERMAKYFPQTPLKPS